MSTNHHVLTKDQVNSTVLDQLGNLANVVDTFEDKLVGIQRRFVALKVENDEYFNSFSHPHGCSYIPFGSHTLKMEKRRNSLNLCTTTWLKSS